MKKKPVSKYPRINSMRVANKFRMNSRAMFHPSIKKVNLIIIEENSEDTKKEIKKQSLASSSHKSKEESKEQRKKREKGKQIAQCSSRPVTRETTRSISITESAFKGTYDNEKNDSFPEINQLQDVPETRE
jgi:hypothetical protein